MKDLSGPSPLRFDELGACQEFSREAGWNQNGTDWRFLLEVGISFGLRRDGRLIASAGIIPYGQFGWICMVLVSAAERRQGFASRLMQECIDWLEQRNVVAGLDATPAGRAVYQQLGFDDVYSITRLEGISAAGSAPGRGGFTLEPIKPDTLKLVAAYDRPRFGGERMELLSRWLARLPAVAHVARSGEQVCGYVLGREGLGASHIGPLVADSEEVALALLDAALGQMCGPVLVDVPDRHRIVHEWLAQRGFAPQRPFTRMLRGRQTPLDRPECIFALTGAEFG